MPVPLDTSTHPLLAEIAELTDLIRTANNLQERRKRLIREAHAAGVPTSQLRAATGLSEQRIYQVLALGNRKDAPGNGTSEPASG